MSMFYAVAKSRTIQDDVTILSFDSKLQRSQFIERAPTSVIVQIIDSRTKASILKTGANQWLAYGHKDGSFTFGR